MSLKVLLQHPACRLSLLAVAVMASVTACGSSPSSTSTSTTADGGAATDTTSSAPSTTSAGDGKRDDAPSREKGCVPVEVDDAPEIKRRVKQGKSVKVTLRDSRASLRVTETKAPSKIAGRFGEDRAYEAKDGRFVGVTYRIRNQGSSGLKPSYDVNRPALLVSKDGKAYRAAGNECGGPISASYAKDQGAQSPTSEVAPGETATTAVVFVVPGTAGKRLTLALPGQDVAVRLKMND